MAKKNPSVDAHMHKDVDVTPDRLRAFRKAKRRDQLLVLARLRLQIADQSSSLEIALAGLFLGFMALVVAPSSGLTFQNGSWAEGLGSGLGLGLGGLIALSPILIPHGIRQGRQERAHVWLAAYEDELNRAIRD